MEKKIKRAGLISHLGSKPWIHKLIDATKIYYVLNCVLKAFPLKMRLSGGFVVRLDSIAAFALAEEILVGDGYSSCLRNYPVETLIDLGCNIGWLPGIIVSQQRPEFLHGIMIDADPKVLESARWHLHKNNLTGCHILHGAVGCPEGTTEIMLHKTGSNTQSSIRDFRSDHPFPLKGKSTSMCVPCIDVSESWAKFFNDKKVDLLKIDIEGSELDFLKKEIHFISTHVRRILCEWHAWHVSFDEIEAFLLNWGFNHGIITEQDDKGGVAFFDNQNRASNKND